jgi:hypothetical protein
MRAFGMSVLDRILLYSHVSDTDSGKIPSGAIDHEIPLDGIITGMTHHMH